LIFETGKEFEKKKKDEGVPPALDAPEVPGSIEIKWMDGRKKMES